MDFSLFVVRAARAMAARCCWPPESWAGQASALSPIPTLSSSARARSSTSALGWRSTVSGASITFCRIVICAHRLNCWNTIERCVRMSITCLRSAGWRAWPSPRQRTGSPRNRMSPCWLSSSRLRQRNSVDLPDPDEPISDTTSPRWAVMSMPFSTSSAP
jgi:hypothetical protein